MEILKHGSRGEVLEPGWLQEKVAAEISQASQKYQTAS
jgi:predicted DNA-binding transcriptional regulator YafY